MSRGPGRGLGPSDRRLTAGSRRCRYAENVTVDGCGAVRRLSLTAAAVQELPRAWLRDCPALEALQLMRLRRLRDVPADALRDATALLLFELTRCPLLRRLPGRLFAENFNLYKADLSNNGLVELPVDLFGDSANSLSE